MREGIRTPDIQIHSLAIAARKGKAGKQVTETGPKPFDETFDRESQIDPDLARVMTAWPALPEHVRQAILTLAKTAG